MLQNSQITYFKENGFLSVKDPNVFSQNDLDKIITLSRKTMDKYNFKDNRMFVDDLHIKHPDFVEFALRPKIIEMVSSLIGPDVGLAWSSGLFKPAHNDFHLGWHSDYPDTNFFEELAPFPRCTLVIAATPATRASGCFEFARHTHFDLAVRKSGLPAYELIEKSVLQAVGKKIQYDDTYLVNVELNPGDISFHDSHVIHRTWPNTTDQDRFLLGYWFHSTNVDHLSQAAIEYLQADRSGKVHVKGFDKHKICAHSIVR